MYTRAKLWSILNLSGLVGVITVNALANIAKLNGVSTGEISDRYPNLFTPAGITFSVWGLIYLLLFIFSVYGIVSAFGKKEAVSITINQISPWFLLTCIANISWLFAWHYLYLSLSAGIMSGLLIVLCIINERLRQEPRVPYFFIKLPFEVYLGWISIATMANLTALLVQEGWNRAGMSEDFWLSALLLIAIGLTVYMALRGKNMGFTAVVIWALIGIVIKRQQADDKGPVGFYIACTGIVLLSCLLLYLLYCRFAKKQV